MLYYNFRNYEEFKELFGIQYHANGVKSRKNKILLAYIKNRKLLHDAVVSGDYSLLHISSMAELKQKITERIIRSSFYTTERCNVVKIRGVVYHSAYYRTDQNNGICEDQDFRSIRYVNVENERVFKMRIGKFYRKIIEETEFGQTLPEQLLNYLCEEMTLDWQTYTMGCLPVNQLFVNKDFGRIYDSNECLGDFSSCMVDKGLHYFYENAVDASAAYLENEDGKIIARCIIFNDVRDENDNVWRLAERQYSTDCSEILKRALVDALIKEGHIDGYKQVGAGCGDARAFVDNDGQSLSHHEFSISCDLDWGDTLSYQDSFKYYDEEERLATNYGSGCYRLDTTAGEFEDEDEDDDRPYDDYHEYYCDDVYTVYCDGREYSCDCNNMDDFVWVECEEEYHHEDDVSRCPHCGEYYLDDKGHYSEVAEETYCCKDCLEKGEQEYKEENWFYSEYDDDYFEDEDDVTSFMEWNAEQLKYIERTIHVETFEHLQQEHQFHQFDGIDYDVINEDTRLPFGMRLMPIANAA